MLSRTQEIQFGCWCFAGCRFFQVLSEHTEPRRGQRVISEFGEARRFSYFKTGNAIIAPAALPHPCRYREAERRALPDRPRVL